MHRKDPAPAGRRDGATELRGSNRQTRRKAGAQSPRIRHRADGRAAECLDPRRVRCPLAMCAASLL
jgi:hypothetical protein